MYLKQVETQGPQDGLEPWARSSLYESMVAYFVAAAMPLPQGSRPHLREQRSTLLDYAHDRMVLFGHAYTMLDRGCDDTSTAWVNGVDKVLEDVSPDLRANSGFPYTLKRKSIFARSIQEDARHDFEHMKAALQHADNQPITDGTINSPLLAAEVRLGKIYIDFPENIRQHFAHYYRLLMRQVMSGEAPGELTQAS